MRYGVASWGKRLGKRGGHCFGYFERLESRRLLAIDSWSPIGPGGGGALFSPTINPHDPNEMFVPSDMSQVFHTVDAGATWRTVDFREIQGNWATNVQFTSDPDVAYAVDYSLIDLIDSATPARSDDGGKTWQPLSADPTGGGVFSLLSDYGDPNRIIVTDWRRLFVSLDGGQSFQQRYVTDDTSSGLHVGGSFFDGENIYVGTNQGLLVSRDGGTSFDLEPLVGIPDDERIVSFAGASEDGVTRFYAVTLFRGDVFAGVRGWDHGGYRSVYKLDLGDSSWVRSVAGIGPAANPFFVAAPADDVDTVYVGGGSDVGRPTVFKSSNGGANWTDVFLTSSNQNIATGWSGDGGVRGWSYGENLFGLTVARDDPDRVLVTDFGFAHHTRDGGATWEVLNVHPDDRNPIGTPSAIDGTYRSSGLDNTSIWGVTWVDKDHLIGNYSDIRAARSSDGGESWSFDYSGHDQNTMYRSVVSDTGVVYAATGTVHDMYQSTHLLDSRIDGGGGRVLLSLDKGETWEVMHDFGNVVTWVELDPTNANRLYASVAHSTLGGIYVSDNIQAGANSTWRKLTDPPRTEGHAFNIRVLDDGTLVTTFSGRRAGSPTAFTPSSGVFVSTDGGQSWLDRSDPGMLYWTRDIEVDPHDAEQRTWYASVFSGWGGPPNGLGGLYKTTNRGVSWQRIVDLDRVASTTVSPTNPDLMYLTTESQGLWKTEDLNSSAVFSPVASYPFRTPMRVVHNPYDPEQVWVTSFGNGLLVGRSVPETFQVTRVAATSGGFVAEFSHELDVATLNLYATQTLGPSDVSLFGAVTGPVTGSLLVDPAARTLEFQASEGPLAPDLYSLTIRGAADGVVDISGRPLDGDQDGIDGGVFTDVFTIGPGAFREVGVQDFVRGPGQSTNLPAGSDFGVPVSISDGAGVRRIELEIAFDPSTLTIAAVHPGGDAPDGATLSVSTPASGVVAVEFSSPSALPAGTSQFLRLVADVPLNAGGETPIGQRKLDIRSLVVEDGTGAELPSIDDDALHVVGYFGDVSGNRRINAGDAAQIARVAALLDDGFVSYPLVDPMILGDISGNRRTNASDASLVAQFAALLPVPQIPALPIGARDAARTTPAELPSLIPSVTDQYRVSGFGAPSRKRNLAESVREFEADLLFSLDDFSEVADLVP